MKKCGWPLLLLVLWPYAGIVFADIQSRYAVLTDHSNVVWQLLLAGAVVLCLLNMICALRQREKAVLAGMTAKLLLIPFYGVTFFLGLILFAAPPAVIIIFLLDGLYLLATSAYTLRGVYQAWREKNLPTAWTIILAISQCIFVLDVPGSIAAHCLTREKRRASHAERAPS